MLIGDAERRAFFLLDMMIGDLGGDKQSLEGVPRFGLMESSKLPPSVTEFVSRRIVDFLGVPPRSLRGVVTNLVFFSAAHLAGEVEPPSSKRLTLEGVVASLWLLSDLEVCTFAGVLLGVLSIGLRNK